MSGMYPNDRTVLENGIRRLWSLEIDEPCFTMAVRPPRLCAAEACLWHRAATLSFYSRTAVRECARHV
jgi:hypothetical protein